MKLLKNNKEIGSDFWDIPLLIKPNSFFSNYTWFISGRAALRAILQQIINENSGQRHLKAALPSFLCESMVLPFIKEKIEYKFYSVTIKDNAFQYDYSDVKDCNIILVIDYFGYESFNNNFPSRDKTIIRDLTHSIFIKDYKDADFYYGSLRKWAGFVCGGFAFKESFTFQQPKENNHDYIEKRIRAMREKAKFIDGKIDNKQYLNCFFASEMMLDDCQIARCLDEDVDAANHLDINYLKAKRRENAEVLINGLKKYCIIKKLGDNDCPLFVPILCKNRDKLRTFLKENDIFCPIHWPKFSNNNLSERLYDQELSLVCDQRYTKEDMQRIVRMVMTFMENDKNA